MNKETPYIETTKTIAIRQYNPNYGDDRICVCGHPYYRHFDTYDDMNPCGCKYCECDTFVEKEIPIIEGNYYWVKCFKNDEYEPAKAKVREKGVLYFCFTNGSVKECDAVVDYKELKFE